MKLCIHVRPRDDKQGWAVDVFDGRRAWSETHLGERPGDRIAQMVFARVPRVRLLEVAELTSTTNRGAGGFGSTGQS